MSERRTAADLDPDETVFLTRNGSRRTGGERQFHTGECQSIAKADVVREVSRADLEKRPATYVECAQPDCGDTIANRDHGRTGLIERLEDLDPDAVGGGTA